MKSLRVALVVREYLNIATYVTCFTKWEHVKRLDEYLQSKKSAVEVMGNFPV
jgi:hypothetical protein